MVDQKTTVANLNISAKAEDNKTNKIGQCKTAIKASDTDISISGDKRLPSTKAPAKKSDTLPRHSKSTTAKTGVKDPPPKPIKT